MHPLDSEYASPQRDLQLIQEVFEYLVCARHYVLAAGKCSKEQKRKKRRKTSAPALNLNFYEVLLLLSFLEPYALGHSLNVHL